ncbi:hypothetical protein PMAYCL1PPCAC_22525, partial [Pristionchus mayeri]
RTLYLTSFTLWIVISLLAITIGSQSFLVFVVLRSLAAVSSAVLGVLSPVILADLFHGNALGVALVGMHASEVVSSATIAPIYSSLVVSSGLPWQAGLLPGPILALVPLGGMLWTMKAMQFWIPSMILSAWTYAPEAFLGLSYPSVTTLNSLLVLSGTVSGMPLLLWFAQV